MTVTAAHSPVIWPETAREPLGGLAAPPVLEERMRAAPARLFLLHYLAQVYLGQVYLAGPSGVRWLRRLSVAPSPGTGLLYRQDQSTYLASPKPFASFLTGTVGAESYPFCSSIRKLFLHSGCY